MGSLAGRGAFRNIRGRLEQVPIVKYIVAHTVRFSDLIDLTEANDVATGVLIWSDIGKTWEYSHGLVLLLPEHVFRPIEYRYKTQTEQFTEECGKLLG